MPRGIPGRELKNVTSVNLSDETYSKIISYMRDNDIKGFTMSEFIRLSVENQLKAIYKHSSTYRVIDDDGVNKLEIEFKCPVCKFTDLIYINDPRNQPNKEEEKTRLEQLKKIFKSKKEDMFNGEWND